MAMAVFVAVLLPLRAEPSGDEKKALRDAEQSYKDGAFDLCNDRVAALLKKYPKTELLAEAELLQARALYQSGHSDAAVAAFGLPLDQMPDRLRVETLFWQAESLLDLGKWPEAEQKYRALLALKNADDHTDAANLGLAWALFKQGKETEALPLIQALTQEKAKSPAVQQAQLLQAKIALAKKQFKDAINGLEVLLADKPAAGLTFETDYWLGEAYAENGQSDQAVTAYQRITGKTPGEIHAFPKTLVAKAYLGLGRARHALHLDDQAALAYEQAYRLAENEETQLAAFQADLESARSAKQLPEAVARLQEFAKTSDASAPTALFAIGSVLAEDGQDDKAIGILESLLVAYGKSSWVPAANDQLGRLYVRARKYDLAIKALQGCIDANSDPDLVRAAREQLGEVLLQTKDYAGAAAQFAQLSNGTDASAEDASYNFLLAQASLGKNDVFGKAEADFEKRFPKSAHLKALARAEGKMLVDLGKTDDAKAVYQKAIAQEGGGSDQEALLRALADLQYQTGDLEGTIQTCQMIVNQFPNNSLAAAQRGILVSYELKKLTDDQVEQALIGLEQKYDKQPGAEKVYLDLAEFYSYRQNYVKAQDAFQQLTVNYPNSNYTDQAYFFAGRAAFAHQDYTAARTLLEKVPDNSSFKPNARLLEARVCQRLLNFNQASALCDAVLTTEKSGEHFVEANLLKGACNFELGGQDATRYGQAFAAFDTVLQSKEGNIAQRNEAAVRSAKCWEKMGKTDDAEKLYLDVLFGRVAGDDSTSPVPPEFSWQIEAGWQLGSIREKKKDWRGAIEVYQRMEQIGGAHAQDFHDLVNKLRTANYIYE